MIAKLRIGHLYPDEMNLYGDRGNILTLQRRAEWRGVEVSVHPIGRGPAPGTGAFDLILWGGGQDRDQALVFEDLREHKAGFIREAVSAGAVILAVCGGYQLLGSYYVTADGQRLPGLGIVDLHTVAGSRRRIGNVLVDVTRLGLVPPTLVGFENHSGRTYLGPGLTPLGMVVKGWGNNGEDRTEGVAAGNIFGTYLHGSLLPKNPHFADLLIGRALADPDSDVLPALDDGIELEAHDLAARRLRLTR